MLIFLYFYLDCKLLVYRDVWDFVAWVVKKYEIIFAKKFADKKKVYIFALA